MLVSLKKHKEKTQKHVLIECRITKEKAKHFEYTKYFMEDEEKTENNGRNNIKIVQLMKEI